MREAISLTKKNNKISLENWKIQNNIPNIEFIGFKASLKNISDEYDPKKLDKDFKAYLNKPAFKGDEL